MMNKSYSELITFQNFLDRFNYLRIGGHIGEETFGYNRYLNQMLYKSPEWLSFRRYIITRDMGNDLGLEDYPINGKIYIHHINPITLKDIYDRHPMLLDPENVISVSYQTHSAIHYGDESLLFTGITERTENDTSPWRY